MFISDLLEFIVFFIKSFTEATNRNLTSLWIDRMTVATARGPRFARNSKVAYQVAFREDLLLRKRLPYIRHLGICYNFEVTIGNRSLAGARRHSAQ